MNKKAHTKMHYVCQGCGSVFQKWLGRCTGCQEWNTLVRETCELAVGAENAPVKAFGGGDWNTVILEPISSVSESRKFQRLPTGINELDRVIGGGLVSGAVILVAGDPGIGKSTLLLQLAAAVGKTVPVAYISGEEGVDQIRLRAERLGLNQASFELASSNNLSAVLLVLSDTFMKEEKGKVGGFPGMVIIDSIQTMVSSQVDSAAGTLSQVRECAHELVQFAKSLGICVIVVGHITKDGMVAGPKVLEHTVDTVLYFEGERGYPYRILRTVKNRFGPTDEIGVFDMTDQGLREVSNPSALFLSHRGEHLPGTCVFAGMEGTRPLLMEIQALATPSFLASPRRAVVGWDANRLSMVLAVLEARCQINFSQKDVFLSVLGGLKITEPAADLCVALALLSCIKKKTLPQDVVAFGEIGLTGEIRPVAHCEQRLKEASKLGFSRVFSPSFATKSDLSFTAMNGVKDLVAWFSST